MKAEKIKVQRALQEVIPEPAEPEPVPGRFQLEEPPPAKCIIQPIELYSTDVEDIIKGFQMPPDPFTRKIFDLLYSILIYDTKKN